MSESEILEAKTNLVQAEANLRQAELETGAAEAERQATSQVVAAVIAEEEAEIAAVEEVEEEETEEAEWLQGKLTNLEAQIETIKAESQHHERRHLEAMEAIRGLSESLKKFLSPEPSNPPSPSPQSPTPAEPEKSAVTPVPSAAEEKQESRAKRVRKI